MLVLLGQGGELVRYFETENTFVSITGQLLDDFIVPPSLKPLEHGIPVFASNAPQKPVFYDRWNVFNSGTAVDNKNASQEVVLFGHRQLVELLCDVTDEIRLRAV